MKTLKIKSISFSLFAMMAFAVFFTSCGQEDIIISDATQVVSENESKLFANLDDLLDFEETIQNVEDEVTINISQDLAKQLFEANTSEITLKGGTCSLMNSSIAVGRVDATVYSFTPNNAVWNSVQYKLNYPGQSWKRSRNDYGTYPAIELTSLIPGCQYSYKVRTLCPPCCGSSWYSLKISGTKYFTTYP